MKQMIPVTFYFLFQTHHHCSQKNRERYSLDLFDALNPAVVSIFP